MCPIFSGKMYYLSYKEITCFITIFNETVCTKDSSRINIAISHMQLIILLFFNPEKICNAEIVLLFDLLYKWFCELFKVGHLLNSLMLYFIVSLTYLSLASK